MSADLKRLPPLEVWWRRAGWTPTGRQARPGPMRLLAVACWAVPLLGVNGVYSAEGGLFPLVEEKRQAVLVGKSLFLKQAVARCTGVSLTERTEPGFRPKAGVFPVYLGASRKAHEILGREIAGLDVEGYILHVEPSFAIIYAGPPQTDTGQPQAWAEGDFARRFMGVDHYLPGSLGEVYPRRAEIRVPCGTWVENPVFKARHWSGYCGSGGPVWRVRASGGGGRFQFHHAFYKILDPARFADHPEYYPERQGRRVVPTGAAGWQPCTSNPEVRRITVEHLLREFANPAVKSRGVGVNDSAGYCECPQCLAHTPPGVDPRGREAIGHRFFTFYNAVAEAVGRRHSDVRLGFLAYGALSTPPPFRLHPILMPYLTQNQADAFDPAYRRRIDASFEAWGSVASHLGMYEYLQGGGFLVPRLYSGELARGLRTAHRLGVDGFYGEAYPNWALDGPKLWIAEKLLWNPALNEGALLAEYCDGMFGEASQAMQAYFERLEQVWMQQRPSGAHRGGYRLLGPEAKVAQLTEVFSAAQCEEAWKLVESAEAVARDEAVLARIRFFKAGFGATRLAARRLEAGRRAESALGARTPPPLGECLVALDPWARHPSLVDHMLAARREAPLSFQEFCQPAVDLKAAFRRWDTEVPAMGQLAGRIAEACLSGPDASPVTSKRDLDRRIRERLDAERADANRAGTPCDAAVGAIRPLLDSCAVDAVRLEAEPVLDGRIEALWGAPSFRGQFFNYPYEASPASEATRFWVGRWGDRLYVAFECEQTPANIRTNLVERDAADYVARDGRRVVDGGKLFAFLDQVDSVGVTIPDSRTVVVVTAGGGLFDGKASPIGYTPDWDGARASVGRTATGWAAEIALDLDVGSRLRQAVGPIPGFNFFRVVHRQRSAWIPAVPSRWLVHPGTSGVVFLGAE